MRTIDKTKKRNSRKQRIYETTSNAGIERLEDVRSMKLDLMYNERLKRNLQRRKTKLQRRLDKERNVTEKSSTTGDYQASQTVTAGSERQA